MAAPGPEWTLPRLRIDRDGDWYDDDVEITHPGILANLRAGLRRDAAGHFIQTRVRIPVEVEDAPFVVTRVKRVGEALRAWLNDGTEFTLDPATIQIGADDVPRATVKDGALVARFSRAAAFQLLALTDLDEGGRREVLRLGGRAHVLRSGA
jgi:hypothetical protein